MTSPVAPEVEMESTPEPGMTEVGEAPLGTLKHKIRFGSMSQGRWRQIAFGLGGTCVLLVIGLATTLGVFLRKSDCGPPSPLANATTTFLGSASPGSQVTYVCEPPLVFPDNSRSYTITCLNGLTWDHGDLPTCGTNTERVCSIADASTDLTFSTSYSPVGLEVEFTVRGLLPASLLIDIPAGDETMCSYTNMIARKGPRVPHSLAPVALARKAAPRQDEVLTVVLVDQQVDQRAPFDVRLRSVGQRVAVTLLQEEYIGTVLTTFNTTSTTRAL